MKGDTGDTGAIGATGTTGATGAAGLVWKGAWSSATAYAINDAVTSGGTSYRCKVAHTNQVVTNTTYWEVIAQKGDTGATGATGAAGTGAKIYKGTHALSTTATVITHNLNVADAQSIIVQVVSTADNMHNYYYTLTAHMVNAVTLTMGSGSGNYRVVIMSV